MLDNQGGGGGPVPISPDYRRSTVLVYTYVYFGYGRLIIIITAKDYDFHSLEKQAIACEKLP